VEWVETTGKSIDEAKEAALDRLGVDEPDAEFEILEEAKAGLFGRIRREARVRARIRPTRPRDKQDRRDRRKRGGRKGPGNGGNGSRGKGRSRGDGAARGSGGSGRTSSPPSAGEVPAAAAGGVAALDESGSAPTGDDRPARSRRRRGGRGRGGGTAGSGANRSSTAEGSDKPTRADRSAEDGQHEGEERMSDVTLEEQGEMVQDFLDGLVEAFDLDGELRSEKIDDEMLEVQIVGDDLGLLIGPKGQTLTAVQELARTVVQRRAEGNPRGRFRIDVGGYRQRRREALERFTRTVADEVKASGVQKALEPMNAADRKVVHDTINEIDGVATISEGEDPRRRVVILPA